MSLFLSAYNTLDLAVRACLIVTMNASVAAFINTPTTRRPYIITTFHVYQFLLIILHSCDSEIGIYRLPDPS